MKKKITDPNTFSVRPAWLISLAGFTLALIIYLVFIILAFPTTWEQMNSPDTLKIDKLIGFIFFFVAGIDIIFLIRIITLLFVPYKVMLKGNRLHFRNVFKEQEYGIAAIDRIYFLRFQTQFIFIDGKKTSLLGRTENLDVLIEELKKNNTNIQLFH